MGASAKSFGARAFQQRAWAKKNNSVVCEIISVVHENFFFSTSVSVVCVIEKTFLRCVRSVSVVCVSKKKIPWCVKLFQWGVKIIHVLCEHISVMCLKYSIFPCDNSMR